MLFLPPVLEIACIIHMNFSHYSTDQVEQAKTALYAYILRTSQEFLQSDKSIQKKEIKMYRHFQMNQKALCHGWRGLLKKIMRNKSRSVDQKNSELTIFVMGGIVRCCLVIQETRWKISMDILIKISL